MYVNIFFPFSNTFTCYRCTLALHYSVLRTMFVYVYICTRMPARPRRIVCATIYYIDRSSSNTIEFQASVLRFLRSQPTTCLAGRPPHSLTSLARPPRAVGATPAASTTTAWRPSWRTRPQPHQTTLNFIHEMKLERHKTRARGCHILRSQWRQ